jgi:hypothetical protein
VAFAVDDFSVAARAAKFALEEPRWLEESQLGFLL